MLVAIHQPNFLPWLGYFDRMLDADLFVLLDHVQFERRNYQNRALIRVEDEARWLTVPVVQISQKERIVEKLVDYSQGDGARGWGPKSFQTLRFAYRKAPHLDLYAAKLREIFETRWEKLVDLNLATLEFVRDALEIRTPMVRSSDLQVEGQRSDLLLDICRKVGGRAFLGGMGGSRGYLDKEAFAAAKMGVQWQEFTHPEYPQCGAAPFIRGLSALDLLFNCGPRSAEILRQGKVRRDALLAA